MTTIGLCGFCGAPLAPDGSRRCTCARLTNFGAVALLARARASTTGRDVPTGDDLMAARELLNPTVRA